MMNGAEALVQTLSDCGVEVCFANPGTSEMQLVAALDNQPDMRAVLGLFEGVVTGAADGYGRMADKPAATLLHLGPGLANGLANLHNAKRAYSPIINIVGDHAVDHLQYDAPLTSDVVGVSTPMSDWVRTSGSASDLAIAGREAFDQAMSYPGKIATVIAPADHAWSGEASPETPSAPEETDKVSSELIDIAARALEKDGQSALFLGARALREDALEAAGRIAAASGARLICETFPARLQRGAGRVPVERLPYLGEMASYFLNDFQHIIFIGANPPVSFFAYPGKPSWLSPENAELVKLAGPRIDALDALTRLAEKIGATQTANLQTITKAQPCEDGKLNAMNIGAVIAELMPENAIVSDESVTTGLAIFPQTQGCPKHDWMTLTGGAIGQGLPLAIGAAIACPDRKVLALQADGSGLYTVQSLWTMAREDLDVTTIIFNNSSYAILNIELQRVGVAQPGPKALSLLDIGSPDINWVSISEGMGVPASQAETVAAFREALAEALSQKGPRLVEAIIK